MELDRNSKIYVAGHKGLVGSAIWRNLLSRGYTNLVGRTHSELDLLDQAAVRSFFDQERPDAVVLAAAHVGGIWANLNYRADFIWQNLQIQQNVIVESWRHGVRRLLFLGSTCIYPKDAPQPMREDCLLTSPLEYTNEPYAIAKIAGLKMCESFNLQYGTEYMAVMPTNLYGPGDNFHLENSHVMPGMMRKFLLAKALMEGDEAFLRRDLAARPVRGRDGRVIDGKSPIGDIRAVLGEYGVRGDSVVLWGSGRPMREFLWSDDMADASVHILLNVSFGDVCGDAPVNADGISEVRNCHINVGTGKEVSIASLAGMVRESAGYRGDIVWDSSRPDGTMRKLTDVTKLHSLGWRHRVGLEDGVRMLRDWYLENL